MDTAPNTKLGTEIPIAANNNTDLSKYEYKIKDDTLIIDDKDEPLGRNETGSRAAIPIWLQFMQEALANKPIINFPVPSDIQFLKVQSKSGEPAKFGDIDSNFEIFSQDFLPKKEQPFTSIFQEENF